MARTKLSKDLKEAITLMPQKEKDRLLLRLIAKDAALVQQLEFQLLEGTGTAEERRAELIDEIEIFLLESKRYFYSPGYLLVDLRTISGKINQHVKITKDKYGELELNFFMLNKALVLMGDKVKEFPAHKSRTFNEYVVRRTLKLVNLLKKMHDDYQLDFKPSLKTLGSHLCTHPNMMKIATDQMLDVDSLCNGALPD